MDSTSSHKEEEEENDNSILFVPQVLKTNIFYYKASSVTSSAMPAMMVYVSLVKEQIANLTKLVEGLAKHRQQQDMTIAQLLN